VRIVSKRKVIGGCKDIEYDFYSNDSLNNDLKRSLEDTPIHLTLAEKLHKDSDKPYPK